MCWCTRWRLTPNRSAIWRLVRPVSNMSRTRSRCGAAFTAPSAGSSRLVRTARITWLVAMARASGKGERITPAAAPRRGLDATGPLEQLVEVEPA
jgi:hypothetical protein